MSDSNQQPRTDKEPPRTFRLRLVDHMEMADLVSVMTRGGRRIYGVIKEVGADYIAVVEAGQTHSVLIGNVDRVTT